MDPIDFLFSLERLGMKFGLENIGALCGALGHPERAFPSVHIAGTNGKGSVTVMVETALRAAGYRAARYTSPHLTRVEERYVIDGREVATAALRDALANIQRVVDGLVRTGTLAGLPTFFECATAAAFVLFAEARVDIAVLEVGLGGRLDATNVVHPLVTAITSIDFDHQAQLGDSLASIAREKAGIVKRGVPLVLGPVPSEARRVIEEVCTDRGAPIVEGHVDALDRIGMGEVPLALRGRHQRENAAVAVCVLEALSKWHGISVPGDAIRAGLTEARWPARLEHVTYRGRDVLLDAAHNPAGARALASYLEEIGWSDVTLLFGAMRDKDAGGMLGPLVRHLSRVVCTTAPTPRAASAGELATVARGVMPPEMAIDVVADPRAALERAAASGTRIVAAGSIFLIGPLRDILR